MIDGLLAAVVHVLLRYNDINRHIYLVKLGVLFK